MGFAALATTSPKGGAALNMNMNYCNKMPAGGTVLVEAQVGGPRPGHEESENGKAVSWGSQMH